MWRKTLATAYFALAIWLFVIDAAQTFAQQQAQQQGAIESEHRFTSIETQIITIAADIRELKQHGEWDWLKSLAMIVLVGDAGARQLKKRKSMIINPDED